MIALRALSIIILLTSIEVLVACCHCDEPISRGDYEIDDLSLNNLDNSGPYLHLASSDHIAKEAYGIQLNLSTASLSNTPFKPSLFTSTAQATSCECPPSIQFFPQDTILSIHVITVNDYDPEHHAASDVTRLFKVWDGAFIDIETYLQAPLPSLYYADEAFIAIPLLLIQGPPVEGEHQFNVIVTLSDGRVMNKLTEAVILTNQ